VVPVILYHAGFNTFSGGYVGVDVFFVISGYLITSLIISEKDSGSFSIRAFYERRARRILPALFFILLICVPFAWLWLLPEDLVRFSQSLLAVSGFSSNILFWRTSDYFDIAAELKPLLHTWSLAVEEQFYLFFPPFLILAWRLGKRWMLTLLAVVAVISLAFAQLNSVTHPSAAYYLLPTRSWELLIGAIAAFYLSDDTAYKLSRPVCEVCSWSGLVMLLYAVFAFDKQTPFPGIYALVPTIGAVLIVLCATSGTSVGKFLGNRLFVGVGLISYSAYLWHQPLLAFARHRTLDKPSKLLLGALVMASLALAYGSWKYVEAPFRNRRNFSRKQIFAYSAAGSIFIALIGLAGITGKGFPGRMPRVVPPAETQLAEINNGWCFYSVDDLGNLPTGAKGVDCWLGEKSSTKAGILFGDSYAAQYEPLWDVVGHDADLKINAITTNWCFPSLDQEFTGPKSSRSLEQCLYDRKFVRDNLSKYDFAVLSGMWGDVLTKNKMQSVFDLIHVASSSTRVVVIMASPKQFDSDIMVLYKESLLYRTMFDLTKVTTIKDKKALEANSMLQAASAIYSNVIFVDRDSLFTINGRMSDVTKDGIPFSLDGGHLSIYGSESAGTLFLQSQKYKEFRHAIQ